MKPVIRFTLATLLVASTAAAAQSTDSPTDGQLQESNGVYQAWSAGSEQWLPVQAFWLEYAHNNQGRFWGESSEYPPYEEVNEHDTLLIQLQQGPCLMYFFHSRWRRAQDVRRWDPQYNQLFGCPHVFH